MALNWRWTHEPAFREVIMSVRYFSLLGGAMGGILVALAMSAASTSASAQTIGTDPRNKRCQTLLTCNFTRGGQYRGCLSSYTCRVCRPQRVRCTASDIASGRTRCTELVCTWGG